MPTRYAVARFHPLVVSPGAAVSSEFPLEKPDEQHVEHSPFINMEFPNHVYWVDTHLHTTYLPDAGMAGNFNLGPDDALLFAHCRGPYFDPADHAFYYVRVI